MNHDCLEEPRPYDILCGRNRNSFNNIGNRRFRITISMNVEKYNALQTRHERSKFIASLAQTLRYDVGFRFLKRNGGKINPDDQAELTDDEIRAKIGHALRDLSTSMREARGEEMSVEAKVPRPLPYKKQEMKKEQLKTFPSPIPTPSAITVVPIQRTETDNATIPAGVLMPPPPAIHSHRAATISVPSIREREDKKMCAPDKVRSSAPPSRVLSNFKTFASLESTPLQSNQTKSLANRIMMPKSADEDDLKMFPLEIGEACQSLLVPSPLGGLPSLDDEDDLDDFWRHSEFQQHPTSYSAAILRGSGSVGASVDTGSCDMSFSSCCLSDAIESMSLVSGTTC